MEQTRTCNKINYFEEALTQISGGGNERKPAPEANLDAIQPKSKPSNLSFEAPVFCQEEGETENHPDPILITPSDPCAKIILESHQKLIQAWRASGESYTHRGRLIMQRYNEIWTEDMEDRIEERRQGFLAAIKAKDGFGRLRAIKDVRDGYAWLLGQVLAPAEEVEEVGWETF